MVGQITSSTGGDSKKPFTTNATGVATGLNADRVDGQDAATIAKTATDAAAADATSQVNASAERWVLVDASGAIIRQTGGFRTVNCYQANDNCYIDAGEDVTNNAIRRDRHGEQPGCRDRRADLGRDLVRGLLLRLRQLQPSRDRQRQRRQPRRPGGHPAQQRRHRPGGGRPLPLPRGRGCTSSGARWSAPAANCLTGPVEIHETIIGGIKPGRRGRGADGKALVAIAVEARQGGPGRVRMQRIPNATKDVPTEFVLDHVQRGSEVRTDGWGGYNGVGRAPLQPRRHELQGLR